MSYLDAFEKEKAKVFQNIITSLVNHFEGGDGAACDWNDFVPPQFDRPLILPPEPFNDARSLFAEEEPRERISTVANQLGQDVRCEVDRREKELLNPFNSFEKEERIKFEIMRLMEMKQAVDDLDSFQIPLGHPYHEGKEPEFPWGEFNWTADFEKIPFFCEVVKGLGVYATLPQVSVQRSLIAGKTPDMAKIELRKHFDEPIVAYVLRKHFSGKGAGKKMTLPEIGELLHPENHRAEDTYKSYAEGLLKKAERYKIEIS